MPGAVFLDAVIAPHVPSLIVVSQRCGGTDLCALFVHPLYEVSHYSKMVAASDDGSGAQVLQIPSECGAVCVRGLTSLAERAAWTSPTARESDHPPSEVGFYRLWLDSGSSMTVAV